jgi:probable HAF family extracellular repeat protein
MEQKSGKPFGWLGAAGFFAAVALLAAASGVRAELYAVRDLGEFTDSNAAISGVNNGGAVVGSGMTNGAFAAMLYGGAWTNLGTLGGGASYGNGVNDSLRVAGSSTSAAGSTRAFLWTPGGTDGVPGNPQMKDLSTLGGSWSEAYAINGSGQVAGSAETSGSDYHAFRYSGGAMTDIGALLGNKFSYSYAYGINDSGHVVGEAYDSKWNQVAFFYNGTTAADIGTLSGGDYASAYALNNADQVVGYSGTAAGFEHAFRYAGGVMSDLGTLGGNFSYANAINNNNVIVGVAGIDPYNDGANHAFIYAGGAMVDLNTLLDASGAGWTLVQASDISDAGQIVGFGTYEGVNHGFLLSPVPQITQQPASLAVACQSDATFSVAATPLPLSCQWYRGGPPSGSAIANATNFSLTLSNVTSAQSGGYYAVVANSGASATSAVATLTVLDSTPPVLSGCPGDLTNYVAPGLCSAVVTWPTPTALDACDGAVPVFSAPTNGATFSKGATSVICWASDSSHNTNFCAFTVTVLDDQAPALNGCPGNLTNYVAPGASNAVVSWSNPTATDNCDGIVPVFVAPTNGSTFNLGVTLVSCQATDSSGNTSTCGFSVAVFQVQSPIITRIQVEGTNVLLSFTTQETVHYAVDWRRVAAEGSWDAAMTGIAGTGGTVTVTNLGGATAPARLYRARVTLPVFQVEPPTITAVRAEGTNVLLSLTTQEAAHYVVDCCQNPAGSAWDAVINGITGTGGTVTVTDFGGGTAPARFYRARLISP